MSAEHDLQQIEQALVTTTSHLFTDALDALARVRALLDAAKHDLDEARELALDELGAAYKHRWEQAAGLLAEYVAADERRLAYPGIFDKEAADRLVRARAALAAAVSGGTDNSPEQGSEAKSPESGDVRGGGV